jgi:hypothetical protein
MHQSPFKEFYRLSLIFLVSKFNSGLKRALTHKRLRKEIVMKENNLKYTKAKFIEK